MSLLGVLGDVVSAPFTVAQGLVSGLLGSSNSVNAPNVNVPTVTAPTVDPRYQQLQQNQINSAQNYGNNVGQTEQDYANQSTENSRNQLAQSQAGIKQGYNARGMLYGGQNIGDQNAAAAQAASNQAQNQQNFNQGIYNNAQTLNNNAVSTGFGMAGLGNNSYLQNEANTNLQMQQALQNMKLNQQGQSALGSGVGQALGAVTGNLMRNNGGGLLANNNSSGS